MKLPALFRATPENQLFECLKREWDSQMEGQDDAPSESYEPFLNHAAGIANEKPQDAKYGVFILAEDDGHGEPAPPYEGVVHINHKLPKTSAAELRMVWSLIAPKYQVEPFDPRHFARLTAGFLTGGIHLCGTKMPASRMRMYLGNAIDREHAQIVAAMLEERDNTLSVAVKGSWLHLEGFDVPTEGAQ